MKLKFIIFLLLFGIQISFSQDKNPHIKNWLMDYGVWGPSEIFLNYNNYSENDVKNLRKKLDLMKSVESSNEWDGIYSHAYDGEVGFSQFRLNSQKGFVNFYIYTCLPELQTLNYGEIKDLDDVIQTISQSDKTASQKRKTIKYVKIKWGERKYLVEESALPTFAEAAAGVYVGTPSELGVISKWMNYWVQQNSENSSSGLPEFPPAYKKFERFPIKAKITVIGQRVVEEKDLENISPYISGEKSAWYPVTINAGKNLRVKVGMTFYVPEIQEQIIITKVNSNTSNGFIQRNIDEKNSDNCNDENYQQIPCKEIKPLLKVETQMSNLLN